MSAFKLYYQMSNRQNGRIDMIIGPMYSEKTTSMANSVRRYQIAKKKCIIICHTNDIRYDALKKSKESLMNHDKVEFDQVRAIKAVKLEDVDVSEYDVIGIDEIGFFSDFMIVNTWANNGKIIIAAGLDGNYKQESFNKICDLIPHCENIIKLKAVCMECSADASFTHRMSSEQEEIVVGGADKYVSLCRMCLNNKK